ncbi:MAG: hypothetical protein ACQETE_16385 [Bacteroidota bacterium]
MKHSLIQSIEESVQRITAPYLFGNRQSEISNAAQVLKPLYNINIEIVRRLHTLLKSSDQPERSPTFLGRYVLWTRSWPDKLEQHYQSMSVEHQPIDRVWLNQRFTEWRDLWAGLQFAQPNWMQRVSEEDILLGHLNGKDWLTVVDAHTQYRIKQWKKLSSTNQL